MHVLKLLERGVPGIGYLLKDRVSDVREFTDGFGGLPAAFGDDPEVVAPAGHPSPAAGSGR